MLTPDRHLIENGTIREGRHHDFKEQLNLDSEHGKSKFIDQVVAFLNATGGHLIVGVKEKGGGFETFRPLLGDAHAWAERIRSLVSQHIDPVPNAIETHAIEVDDGYLLDIRIAEHRMQPYQNRLTGGFYVRTDRQNRPIPRNEIYAYFKGLIDYRADLKRLAAEQDALVAEREVMVDEGPTLGISILPREHYEAHAPFSYRRGAVIHPAPGFPYDGPTNVWFKACEGGSEALESTFSGKAISRLFISSEWFIQSKIAHPFNCTDGEGRVTLHELKAKLASYLADTAAMLKEAEIRGPFAVSFKFSHLKRSDKVGWVFHFGGPVLFEPRTLVQALDDATLVQGAHEAILRASRYG